MGQRDSGTPMRNVVDINISPLSSRARLFRPNSRHRMNLYKVEALELEGRVVGGFRSTAYDRTDLMYVPRVCSRSADDTEAFPSIVRHFPVPSVCSHRQLSIFPKGGRTFLSSSVCDRRLSLRFANSCLPLLTQTHIFYAGCGEK